MKGHAPAILATAALTACGPSPITPLRIETALEATVANRLELQIARLQLPAIASPDFAVTAICRKQAAEQNSGAGDWTCTLVWQGAKREMLRDTYGSFRDNRRLFYGDRRR